MAAYSARIVGDGSLLDHRRVTGSMVAELAERLFLPGNRRPARLTNLNTAARTLARR